MGRRKGGLPSMHVVQIIRGRAASPSRIEVVGAIAIVLALASMVLFLVHNFAIGPNTVLLFVGQIILLCGCVVWNVGFRVSKRRVQRWETLHCPQCCYPFNQDVGDLRCSECGLESTSADVRSWWKSRYSLRGPLPLSTRAGEKDGLVRDVPDQDGRRP